MADYQPLIARAVARLAKNTSETRRIVYMSARATLSAQLQGGPRRDDFDITSERLALEAAIRKVEALCLRSALANSCPTKSAPKAFCAPDSKRWEAVARWDDGCNRADQPASLVLTVLQMARRSF
jgi:hypothetical protein